MRTRFIAETPSLITPAAQRRPPTAVALPVRLTGVDGTFLLFARYHGSKNEELFMNAIIYLVGLVVVVLFILSFFGLR